MRLAFLGTADFAVPTLAALIDAGHQIACVLSQPPAPRGRGQAPRPSPVQAFAEARGRVETVHRPYHEALGRLIGEAREAHGGRP